eukprot:gene7566-10307_t
MKKKKVQILPLAEELKLETYPRPPRLAVFDRLDLVVEFRAGNDQIGAVIKNFKNAIPAHDEIVKAIEEKMDEIKECRKFYTKKNRLFRNLDSAWNVMLEMPTHFFDYVALIPKMKNIEERIQLVKDEKIKAELIYDFKRYKELHPICSNQMVIYDSYNEARNERDEALKKYVKAEQELVRLKEKEKELASLISDDHVIADFRKMTISATFPHIHEGYILHRINGVLVEHITYSEVIFKLQRSKSPHEAEFKRYDYRFDPFSQVWRSLQELRDMGVCLEDPMLQIQEFIQLASKGDMNALSDQLMKGQDPNVADYTGCTAMIMAAAYRHPDVIDLLKMTGGDINCRDKNMMTPLLFAATRGYIDVVRQLISLGADKACCDKNQRDVLYYAIQSGNEALVKLFIRPETCNKKEMVWGFSPLHIAANNGNISLTNFLLQFGCSIYSKDKKGKTPEVIAGECGHKELNKLLESERLSAPGQIAFMDINFDLKFWIGELASLDEKWCGDPDIKIDNVLFINTKKNLPSHAAWLSDDDEVKLHQIIVTPTLDDDPDEISWNALHTVLPLIISTLTNIMKNGSASVLICDDTCDEVSPAILATILLIKYQTRCNETLNLCCEARPSCNISQSFRKGLDSLQRSIDQKVMHRLNSKLRNCIALSSGF